MLMDGLDFKYELDVLLRPPKCFHYSRNARNVQQADRLTDGPIEPISYIAMD